jgi:hypothetical protein
MNEYKTDIIVININTNERNDWEKRGEGQCYEAKIIVLVRYQRQQLVPQRRLVPQRQ